MPRSKQKHNYLCDQCKRWRSRPFCLGCGPKATFTKPPKLTPAEKAKLWRIEQSEERSDAA